MIDASNPDRSWGELAEIIAHLGASDIADRDTVILERAQILRAVEIWCPVCLMEFNAVFSVGRLDARYAALVTCQRHLFYWQTVPEEQLPQLMQLQYEAIYRWLNPYGYGQQE
jgi:hypothetical protein